MPRFLQDFYSTKGAKCARPNPLSFPHWIRYCENRSADFRTTELARLLHRQIAVPRRLITYTTFNSYMPRILIIVWVRLLVAVFFFRITVIALRSSASYVLSRCPRCKHSTSPTVYRRCCWSGWSTEKYFDSFYWSLVGPKGGTIWPWHYVKLSKDPTPNKCSLSGSQPIVLTTCTHAVIKRGGFTAGAISAHGQEFCAPGDGRK